MNTFTVESIDRHEDGSVTLYGRSNQTDDPVVQTYPAGALITRVVER